jgi:hypothetical protein
MRGFESFFDRVVWRAYVAGNRRYSSEVCARLLQPVQTKSLTLVGETPRRKVGRRQR